MAERAVLASERERGWYDRYTARWAGTDRALAAVFDGETPRDLPDAEWEERKIVPFRALVETLDYLGTAVVYRETTEESTVFLPLWFGLPLPDEPAPQTRGGLISVRSLSEFRKLRRWFRTLKGSLTDAVRAGWIAPSVVTELLRETVSLLSDREVHLPRTR